MKTIGLAHAVVTACLLSLLLPSSRGSLRAAETDNDATSAAPGKERKILFWKSPMDPNFVSKSPGKDPMGMDLVPVYEGEAAGGAAGSVRIDPATTQDIGVKTAVVRRQRLAREIRTFGRIAYDESKVRSISPKIGGWVERQYVSFPGQIVDKGEPLLRIYSPELVATEEEYLLALRYRKRLEGSSLPDSDTGSSELVRSAETRLRYWDIDDRQIEALRRSGHVTRTMALHAPFRGIILEKHVLEGGYVKPGENLYRIADISEIWVYADVYEYEAPWLGPGQEATVTLAYHPGAEYRGKVVYIYPYLKNKTRTLEVRMTFPNTHDFALKPDMWANVTIRASLAEESLAVPVQAVIRTGKRDVVLVALGGGHFAPRQVRLGAEAGDEFEVLDGLREGDRVVTSAQFLINSESSLRSALGKMIAPEPDEKGSTEGSSPSPSTRRQDDGGAAPAMPDHGKGS
jgi:Cu(I)/Ag(I) efflux system membrane fusion protein